MSVTTLPENVASLTRGTTGGRARGVAGACSGNFVEWYDFFIYAYMAIYFAPSFFPSGNSTSQLLASAGVLAVGYFMRPLGGWLFGWIADTRGRKLSMILSVSMMCAGSLMIASLPTYEAIGVGAPILLLIARLVQGLSIGGEYGAGATYLSEIAPKGKRGFYASFQYFTLIAGQLVALMVLLALQAVLTDVNIKDWGWRIPFFIGGAFSVIVFYLRQNMQETGSIEAMHRKEAGSLKGLWQHKRAVMLVMAFTMGGSLYFYVFTAYMQKLLINTAGISATTTSIIMTLALASFMCMQPIFGMLSDRIGIKNNMLLFTGLATLAVVPLLSTLAITTNPYVAFILVMIALVIAAFYTPVAGLVKADLFPPEVRCLGVGFPYTGILSALLMRERTGHGSHIEVSMLEALGEWMGFPLYYTYGGKEPPPRTGASHATIFPYGPFPTGDGGTVMLGLQNEREWVAFCEKVLFQPALAQDERFVSNVLRVRNREALTEIIVASFAASTAEAVTIELHEAGIANARVRTMAEVWDHPQLQARGRWTKIITPSGSVPALLPPAFPKGMAPRMDPVPALGAHNASILTELGLDDARISALREAGAI